MVNFKNVGRRWIEVSDDSGGNRRYTVHNPKDRNVWKENWKLKETMRSGLILLVLFHNLSSRRTC